MQIRRTKEAMISIQDRVVQQREHTELINEIIRVDSRLNSIVGGLDVLKKWVGISDSS